MAGVFEQFYDLSPIGVIDQNKWTEFKPGVVTELVAGFRSQSVFSPLIGWSGWEGEALNTFETELIPGDVTGAEIPMTANYVSVSQPFDSRMRQFALKRYADKTQLHKSDGRFQQWLMSGSKDWRPLMKAVLTNNYVRFHEALSRNAFLSGPKEYWTYANGVADLNALGVADTFQLESIDSWNLRLGNTGNPIVPGDVASAKLCLVAPGVKYDIFQQLKNPAFGSVAALWTDIIKYQNASPYLRNEIGNFKGVRFVESPNDMFGMNPNVLYNCGSIFKQVAVTQQIKQGDGCPDPTTTMIDGWFMGQKNVTHYVQVEDIALGDFSIGDWVTIHIKRTAIYGVTGGVDPTDIEAITRRITLIDVVNNRLSFDRPIMKNYDVGFYDAAGSVTGATPGTFYAFLTRAVHVGLTLVLGSREGIQAKVYQSPVFYEPEPIDDFKSVYRLVWDEILGWSIGNPHMFEVHFTAVTLPKPGGIIPAGQ